MDCSRQQLGARRVSRRRVPWRKCCWNFGLGILETLKKIGIEFVVYWSETQTDVGGACVSERRANIDLFD